MADDDVRPGFGPQPNETTPNRGQRRAPVSIEGEAEPVTTPGDQAEPHVEASTPVEAIGAAHPGSPDGMPVDEPSMAAAADLAAPDRPAETFAPSIVPPAQRTSVMPALLATIGLVLIVLLGINLYLMIDPPGQDNLAAVRTQTNGLEQRVAALERRPAAGAALGPLDERLKTLEAKVNAAPEATPPAQDQDLAAKIAALQTQTGGLDHALADVRQQVAAIPKPDLAPLDARIADVTTGLAALKTDVAALPKVDLAPLDAKIDALDHRLAPVEAEYATPKITANVTEARQEGSAAETRAAPVAVVSQAILQALDDGKGFMPEVAALESLGADPSQLAALRPVAATGAATKADLIAGFAAVRDAMITAAAPIRTGTMFDRMMANAQSLVKVRAAGASPGNDPDAVVSRIDAALGAGDLKAALSDWTALPDASKAASAAWAGKLKARVLADSAARAIGNGAIAALGPTP